MTNTTSFYKIVPIDADFLRRVREDGVDDLGQPVERSVAEGGEPLRDVLRRAQPGEAILLASYCPFTVAGPYREYGPVFVLADAQPASAADAPAQLPIGGPGSYLHAPFVLRAYGSSQRIVDALLTPPDAAQDRLERLLAKPQVAFVLARFAAYGCYALRLERAA